jgi:hypothetical protein
VVQFTRTIIEHPEHTTGSERRVDDSGVGVRSGDISGLSAHNSGATIPRSVSYDNSAVLLTPSR